MSSNRDEELKKIITEICGNAELQSSERERKKLMQRLLISLQQLPGLLKSSHVDYPDALNQTWVWVIKNICNFQPDPHLSIQQSLTRWINRYLSRRIRDLYRLEARRNQLRLDSEIDNSVKNLQLSGINFSVPGGIDSYIEKLEQQEIQQIYLELERYIEEDPQRILRSCHPWNYPDCNGQFLSKKLLLKDPPDRLADISRELGIKYQIIYDHWIRKCKPLLRTIAVSLGELTKEGKLATLEVPLDIAGHRSTKQFHKEEVDNDTSVTSPKQTVFYRIVLITSPDLILVGDEFKVAVELNLDENGGNNAYLLEVPLEEAVGSELNILLSAPGFQCDRSNAASLPLDVDARRETLFLQPKQIAYFRLTALRPGSAMIRAELYRGDTFETTLEAKVQVTGFNETSFTGTRITTQPRPVPQPDFILRVQTAWNETNSACRFQYQLRSFRLPSLFPGETNYHSESLSSRWIEQMRGLWGTTLENISDALPEDGRSHLTSLGQYLFQHLLPTELQSDFRNLIPRDRTFTLLILADQDASLPWELLHDGQRFLSDRFIIGRWFWELNDTRPHEFPVGAINVAHYADVEQPELWTALLEPPGSPPPLPLPEGVLGNLDSTEVMRGLHLIRYSQLSDAANRRNAPVTLDDTNNAQDIERQMRPAKLNLRRNRPLVSLGYVRRSLPELTTIEQTWASAFIHAGCSAFTGSLWAVAPAVEAAFISGFYNRLWTGDSLGEAFYTSRQLARAVAPDSLDWLAYVLFGDPMARPYRPVEGKGYAVVEPIGREIDDPLPPGVPVRFRLSLRRTPPVWHEERVIEVAENLTFENLQAHVKTFGLQVTPDSPIAMSLAPTGNYLGWFTLVAPPEMAGNSALVQVFLMDGMLPIHSLMFSLTIENEGGD